MAGKLKFGPDSEWVEWDPARAPPPYHVNPARGDAFYSEIRKYWPALKDGQLTAAYSGLRAKVPLPALLRPVSAFHCVPSGNVKPSISAYSNAHWLSCETQGHMERDRAEALPVQLSGPGQPKADFSIQGPGDHSVDGLVNLYGIESPGAPHPTSLLLGSWTAGQQPSGCCFFILRSADSC